MRINSITPYQYKKQYNTINPSFKSKFQLIDSDLKGANFNAFSLSAISPIKKHQEINKNKKLLAQTYDLIFKDMADEAKQLGVDFVKPELVFKPLDKGMNALYITGENKVVINSNKLYSKSNARFTNGNYVVVELENGKEIPCVDFAMSAFKKLPKGAIYVEGDEKIFSLAGTIKHELTHALQEQIMLSAKGSLETLYKKLKTKHPKEYRNFSFDDFKRSLPFYANYQTKDGFDLNKEIKIFYDGLYDNDGNTLQITYTPLDIINHKVNYDSDDKDKYYTDIMEIEARMQQAEFYMDYEKYLPKIRISPEAQSYYYNCMVYTCQTLLE